MTVRTTDTNSREIRHTLTGKDLIDLLGITIPEGMTTARIGIQTSHTPEGSALYAIDNHGQIVCEVTIKFDHPDGNREDEQWVELSPKGEDPLG